MDDNVKTMNSDQTNNVGERELSAPKAKPVLFVEKEASTASHPCAVFLMSKSALEKYRFETDLAQLDPRDLVIFTALDHNIADFITDNEANNYSFLLFKKPTLTDIEEFEAILNNARQIIFAFPDRALAPEIADETDNMRIETRYITPLPASDKDLVLQPTSNEDNNTKNLNIIEPENYTALWETILHRPTLPESIHLICYLVPHTPEWFVKALKLHGIKLSQSTLTLSDFYKGTLPKHLADIDHAIQTLHAPLPLSLYLMQKGINVKSISTLDSQSNIRADAARFPLTIPVHKSVSAGKVLEYLIVLNNNTSTNKHPENRTRKPLTANKIKTLVTATHATAPEQAQTKTSDIVNIVCFNPTYLFADLVKRFEDSGCVHSEIPLENADRYIWMRPQEYIAFLNHLEGAPVHDVNATYKDLLIERKIEKSAFYSTEKIKSRSTVIHHGICPAPIHQFDPYANVIKLSAADRVSGVCPFELCYRQMAQYANPHNFVFNPIGYDHKKFTAELIRKETRQANEPLIIGFVGRAYGVLDKNKLDRNPLATPKGFIKGGDHLINIGLRLKALNIKFEFHIIGKNWDNHVEIMDQYNIPYVYYERDKNVSYNDFPEIFADFDVLLIPSRGESGPVPAVEAMAMGVPVVGCENAGMVSYLADATPYCKTFSYDLKWHIPDLDKAISHVQDIYKRSFTYEDRLQVRQSVESLTTQKWIDTLSGIPHAKEDKTHNDNNPVKNDTAKDDTSAAEQDDAISETYSGLRAHPQNRRKIR